MLPCRALPCRALPCCALPCRALPCRALSLIREYSKPLTRPDWRKSNPIISVCELYQLVYDNWDENDLYFTIYRNIVTTYWYDIYWCIKIHGVYMCCSRYNITRYDIRKLGIQMLT